MLIFFTPRHFARQQHQGVHFRRMSWASITSSSEVARNGLSYSPKICRTRSKPPPLYTSLYPDSSRKTFALEALPPTPQKRTTGLVLSAGRRDGSKNVHVDVSQVTFRAPKGPGLASTSPGPRTSMKVGSFNARRTASSAMTTGTFCMEGVSQQFSEANALTDLRE